MKSAIDETKIRALKYPRTCNYDTYNFVARVFLFGKIKKNNKHKLTNYGCMGVSFLSMIDIMECINYNSSDSYITRLTRLASCVNPLLLLIQTKLHEEEFCNTIQCIESVEKLALSSMKLCSVKIMPNLDVNLSELCNNNIIFNLMKKENIVSDIKNIIIKSLTCNQCDNWCRLYMPLKVTHYRHNELMNKLNITLYDFQN